MADTVRQLEIRRARLKDAAAIADLSGQLGYPTTQQEMADRLARLLRLSRVNQIFIAEAPSGDVAGWIHVSMNPLLEVPLRAEVNGLIVADGQRSLGAGAKLLQAAETWARHKGCQGMAVRSNVMRDRAHSFYLRNGYEYYKTQKAFRKNL